ncbi:UNVERIFIED_CONTAM: hypothetical protein HDU68_002870 [Siphonaria sp. JEL0065]|nr:hypothetical protein HDU68_002870 [Siphonaria sp. JEL0065]
MDADYAFFKDLLLKHCINRPPFSEQIFTFAEMKLITDFATNTYFRHYLMYKYTFTKQIKTDFKITNAYMTPIPSLENINIIEADDVVGGVNVVVSGSLDVAPNAEASSVVSVEPITLAPDVLHAPVASGRVSSVSEPNHASPTEPIVPIEPEAPKEEKTLEQSKQEIATTELRNFVISTLAPKLDEMKTTLLMKLAVQEEQLGSKIKKLEAEEEKIMATLALDKKKDPKAAAKGKK